MLDNSATWQKLLILIISRLTSLGKIVTNETDYVFMFGVPNEKVLKSIETSGSNKSKVNLWNRGCENKNSYIIGVPYLKQESNLNEVG